MGRSGTTLRWLACAALAVVATTLVVSFTRDDQSPSTGSVPVAESSPAGTIASHTPVSSSSTPDAQAGPPSRPDAARGLSIASAEAFVQYYLGEAVNHLKLTARVAPCETRAARPAHRAAATSPTSPLPTRATAG
jgi:hypothetical protein